jgi:DNA-binding MarR family transcriptional regulator
MATRKQSRTVRQTARRPDDLTGALDGIRRIVQTLRVSARTAERALGVSGAQLFVLHSLAEAPAASLNDLAERTFTHQSSVSVVVERLVRRRLVSRTRSAEDGRRIVLSLTPAGRRVLEAAPEIAQIRLIGALRALSASERRALARTLARLSEAMGITEPPPLLFEDEPSAVMRGRRAPRAASRAQPKRNHKRQR